MNKRTIDSLGGMLSGLVVWAGSLMLPEWRWLQDLYPGAAFGVFLFALHGREVSAPARRQALNFALCLIASVASWRCAVLVYPYQVPLAFVVSGAVGGLLVGLGCLAVWRSKSLAALSFITLAGLVSGLIFQLIDRSLYSAGEDIWVLVLVLEWQTLVLVTIGLARERYGSR